MNTIQSPDVNAVPLEEIDVSRPELFKNDTWQPWFARLRKEAPVHYLSDSVNGPFWSVTSHQLIKEVDTHNGVVTLETTDPARLKRRVGPGPTGIRLSPRYFRSPSQITA